MYVTAGSRGCANASTCKESRLSLSYAFDLASRPPASHLTKLVVGFAGIRKGKLDVPIRWNGVSAIAYLRCRSVEAQIITLRLNECMSHLFVFSRLDGSPTTCFQKCA